MEEAESTVRLMVSSNVFADVFAAAEPARPREEKVLLV